MVVVMGLLAVGVALWLFALRSGQRKPDAFQEMMERRRERRRDKRRHPRPEQPPDPNFQFDDVPPDSGGPP